MYNFEHEKRFSHLDFRLVCFFFYIILPVFSQCTRQSDDNFSTPNFLCSYQVNVTRMTGCSTQVVESMVFPHNSGSPWWRDVPLLKGQSINATSISVRREGRATNFTFHKDDRITVQSPQNNDPVKFDLSYTIINGVTRYIGGCSFSNDGDLMTLKNWMTLNSITCHGVLGTGIRV